MNKPDGHRIVETTKKDDMRIVDCTRWEEIKECVNYHASLAALLFIPTIFKVCRLYCYQKNNRYDSIINFNFAFVTSSCVLLQFLNNPGARVGGQQLSVAAEYSHKNVQDEQYNV